MKVQSNAHLTDCWSFVHVAGCPDLRLSERDEMATEACPAYTISTRLGDNHKRQFFTL